MRKLITTLTLFTIAVIANSQQPDSYRVTKADYDRAVSFQWPSLSNKKVFNVQVDPVWFRDSSGFAYILQSKEGKTYQRFLFSKKVAEPLFDQAKLATILNDKLKTTIKPTDLPVNIVNVNKDTVEMIVRGKTYKLDLQNYNLTELPAPARQMNQSVSPNGEWIAYAENYNLFIRSVKTGEKKQLSHAGVRISNMPHGMDGVISSKEKMANAPSISK
jgi:dipeptidyl-peptidase 4